MAWNKPTSNTGNATSSSRSVERGKMPRLRRGLLAGAIVVLGAGLAAWLLTNGEAVSSSLQKKNRGLIKEVAPAAAPKCKQEAVNKPKKLHYWEQATTNGLSDWQIAKWRNSRLPPPAITNTAAANRPPPEYAIFGTRAENEIAALITMPPGTMVVGTPEYGEEFKQQFLKSCETPIIIEKDDSDYVRQLKKDMIDLKIELRQRMADGEDIGKIMSESRAEMVRLGMLKNQIESETHQLIEASAKSEEDIDDLFNAANKLLESQGIAPIEDNPLVKRSLMRELGLKKSKKKKSVSAEKENTTE